MSTFASLFSENEPMQNKCDIKAVQLRNEGNKFYSKGKFFDALKLYNQSLCYAKSDLNLSLAYANRSAVYFEVKLFKLCLENIGMALKHNYPNGKIIKLLERKKKCEENQSNENPIPELIQNFFKLSHPANPKIPFIINDLELQTDNTFGRGIYTKRNLKCGDVIAVEKPFYSILQKPLQYERCCVCLKNNFLNLFPCPITASVMFCSNTCIIHASALVIIDSYDTLLCDDDGSINQSYQRFNYELTKMANFDMKFVENVWEKCEAVSVFDFDWSDPSDKNYNKNLLRCVFGLKVANQIEKEDDYTSQFAVIFMHNFINHLEMKRVECGYLLLFGSLFNHSCEPNVKILKLYNGQFVITITRPIKKGEQLFMSYNNFSDASSETRQEILLGKFGFICKCDKCVKGIRIKPEESEINADEMEYAKECVDYLICSSVEEIIDEFLQIKEKMSILNPNQKRAYIKLEAKQQLISYKMKLLSNFPQFPLLNM